MNVKDLIAQADNLVGQPIEVEGELIILQDGDRYVTYIYAAEESQEEDNPQQILIAYSISKLKTIMRPLPSMQLLYRGKLTHAPYYWRFPIEMRVQIDMNAENKPMIKRIFALSFDAPYGSKFLEFLPHPQYHYRAELDYDYVHEEFQNHHAQALVTSEHIMHFTENSKESIRLGTDDNRYARNLLHKTITIPGWLRYIGDRNHGYHFVLRTFAVRTSMFSVGMLKDLTSIWWKPSRLYQVIRAHVPNRTGEDLNLQVAITGQIAYLSEQDAPHLIGGTHPKLVFSQIDKILIREEYFLH